MAYYSCEVTNVQVYLEEDIRQIDAKAVQEGFSLFALMENAGRGLAEKLKPLLQKEDRILFLAGRGNNGGDGIVIARFLMQNGYDVTLTFPLGEPKTEVAQRHLTFYEKQNYQ